MAIDKIREQFGIEMSQSSEWIDVLNNSNPGHYGVEDWDVFLHPDRVWADISSETFTFSNAKYNFKLFIGNSSYDDGQKMNLSKVASGKGVFAFDGTSKIRVEELEIEMDFDLFPSKLVPTY